MLRQVLRKSAAGLALAVVVLGLGVNAACAAIIVNADVTAPGDPSVGTSGNVSGDGQVTNAIDDITTTKYLNFDKVNTGLITTPVTNGPSTLVSAIRFTTANDHPERDPLTVTLEGTQDASATTNPNSAWTLIYSGTSGLD